MTPRTHLLRLSARRGDGKIGPAVMPSPLWTVGLAAALVLVLGGITLLQLQRLRALAAHVGALSARVAAQERLIGVVARPTFRTTMLQGSVQANVRLVYDPAAGQGALVVTDLRDPGARFVYQVWLFAGQEPKSAGVFRPIAGQPLVVPVNADFRRYQAVAISVEQGPTGSPAGPTSVPVLAGTI